MLVKALVLKLINKTMKNKTLLWVGIASALLIGGGVFWWMRNRPKTDDTKDDTKDTKTDDTITLKRE